MRGLLCLLACLACVPCAGIADKSALVIGNSAYLAVEELENPKNDALAVSEELRAQGFDVDVALDVDHNQMLSMLREFRNKADRSEYAIVYYAGHGIEIAGVNYLVPVDARIQDPRDARVELIDLNTVMDQISGAREMKMVVLDACRNNPFVALMKKSNRGRGIGRGLGQVDTAEADTLIAYAAAAGAITPDGAKGRNSPFTAAFVKAMRGPPRDVRRMLGMVRDEMRQSVPGAAPFVYTSLGGGEFIINPNSFSPPVENPSGAIPPASNAPADVPNRAEQTAGSSTIFTDFLAADKVANIVAWDAFLARYAGTSEEELVSLALQRRSELMAHANTRSTQQEKVAEPAKKPTLPVPLPATRKQAVRALQELLKSHGCYRGYLDGIYGRGTARGVQQLAELENLPVSLPARPEMDAVVSALQALSVAGDSRCKLPARVTSAKTPKPKATATPAANTSSSQNETGDSGGTNCLTFEGQNFCN